MPSGIFLRFLFIILSMKTNNIKEMLWVNKKLKELQDQKKRNRFYYITLALILTIINLSTIVVAIIAIDYLNLSTHENSTAVILSSLSASFVVIIFFLHNLNIIYKGIMKDKKYKKAMDNIQHEVMKYNYKTNCYIGENKEEVLIQNCEAQYKKAITKTKKNKFTLFLRALSGGENV